MMNLNTYIKNEFIKNKLNETSYELITTLDESENIANRISSGEYINIIFESSYLKNRFFSILKSNRPEVSIINCNSSLEVLINNIMESNDLIVFNNIHNCKNDVLNIISDKKSIWIC